MRRCAFIVASAAVTALAGFAWAGDGRQVIELRAWGVPEYVGSDVNSLARLAMLEEFTRRFPHIKPVATTGLQIPGRTQDMIPLMQIAGDIAPDVMDVNFRQSHTYVQNKLLYPLEKYIEGMVSGAKGPTFDIRGGQALSTLEYRRRLAAAPGYARENLEERIPPQSWDVIRRECPYGDDCPYLRERKEPQSKLHYHIWAFPSGPEVMAIFYRRDLLADAGLPDRAPADLDEMFEWAKKLTNPKEDAYGLQMSISELSWGSLSVLYSMGGLIVDQQAKFRCPHCGWEGYARPDIKACPAPQCGKAGLTKVEGAPLGDWVCVFDSEEAVEAYYYVARLFLEPFTNASGGHVGVVYMNESNTGGEVRCAMHFNYLSSRFFEQFNTAQVGFGPVPVGPTGKRGSEFNSDMIGIYAGLESDEPRRQAAWEYIRFFDCPQSRIIRAKVFVENGQAQFIRKSILEQAGYPEFVRQVPKGWEEAYEAAVNAGIPEPYGRNCQHAYTYVSKAINQMRTDDRVKAAMALGPAGKEAAKDRIREILKGQVIRANEKMLDLLSPDPYKFGPTIGGKKITLWTFDNERSFRNSIATAVAVAILITFAWIFRRVSKVFSQVQGPIVGKDRGTWQFGKFKWAYILMAPALASIALWAYYPLARGTVIAFQNYNVRGFSEWVGMDNFASVLFDEEFWFAMWVSLKYTILYMIFGFGAPIILAVLLTEVPRGKVLYRTIYYLPAVLTGVIVIFLWKGFYGSNGMINQVCNYVIAAINWAFSWAMSGPISPIAIKWLDEPRFALLFCLLPSIWAGMGPGCLIYLAALKTVPDDIYEAADIDGAGIWSKFTNVALPSIKALILINFIGAMIGAMKSGAQFMLAMTGGGPNTPLGETEVIGLHIFWQAYAHLRFGAATAMAWILGSLLIGFTVYRLQQLSRMEFRTASGTGN
ncbi:MAG: extracellular solute-binding protein [Phycisphaerae bacterium]